MPKAKGTYLAKRTVTTKTRNGERPKHQVAFIPAGDEEGFPAVMNVDLETFGALGEVDAGVEIELKYIETPPYGDRLAIDVALGVARGA